MANTMQFSSASSVEQDSSSPSSANKPGGWKTMKYIIGNQSFEKLSSMSLIGNITVSLQNKYNVGGVLVVNIVTIWNGSNNVASIAGAFVSDAYLGRFRTLLFGSIASFLGMGTMTLTAGISQLRPANCHGESNCPQPKGWQLGVLFGGLALLSIGAGCIRPCNIAFGADQFDTTTEKGRAQLEKFFNWWYFSFTISLLIALIGVVYVQTNVSWFLGFAIPSACFAISLTIFLIGQHCYIYIKPQGSIFGDMAKVIAAAFRNRRLRIAPGSENNFYDSPLTGSGSQIKLKRTNRFKFLDKAAIITEPSDLLDQRNPKNGWRLCSLQQVEQVKCLVAILPVWVSGIASFIPMDQQTTFGLLQAIQMDKSLGRHFKMPAAWMNLTSMIALSIWIFTYERICVPLTKKMSGKEKRLTLQQRIKTGIIMSILCMLVAGFIEKRRRESALKQGSFSSPMSVAFLLPQFVLSGLVEAFASVAIMEFFTMQMPESMRTVAGAAFFLSLSIASYISYLVVNIIHHATKKNGKSPWLGGHDLNKNRLDYYYYIIAGLAAINLVYFCFFASGYVVNSVAANETEEVQLENSITCDTRNLTKTESMDEEKGLESHDSN